MKEINNRGRKLDAGCWTLASVLILISFTSFSQPKSITLDEAISLGLKNNAGVLAASQQVSYQRQLKKTSSELPKTNFMLMGGQYNSIAKDNNFTVTQSIPFPTVFAAKSSLANAEIKSNEARRAVTENELIYQIKSVYFRLEYLEERSNLLQQQDSLFSSLANAAARKLQAGEGTLLEQTKAIAQLNEIKNLKAQNDADHAIYESQLIALLNSKQPVTINFSPLAALEFPSFADSSLMENNINLQYAKHQTEVAQSIKRLDRASFMPDLTFGYFNQSLTGFQKINGSDVYFDKSHRFTGLLVGLSFPLWLAPNTAKVKAAEYNLQSAQSQYQQTKINWLAQTRAAYQESVKFKNSLAYYQQSGLPMAQSMQQQALKTFRQGEISFSEFLLTHHQALSIQESYWQTLLNYNLSIIQLEYLTAQQQ